MPAAGITWANAIPYLLVTIVLTLLGSTDSVAHIPWHRPQVER